MRRRWFLKSAPVVATVGVAAVVSQAPKLAQADEGAVVLRSFDSRMDIPVCPDAAVLLQYIARDNAYTWSGQFPGLEFRRHGTPATQIGNFTDTPKVVGPWYDRPINLTEIALDGQTYYVESIYVFPA